MLFVVIESWNSIPNDTQVFLLGQLGLGFFLVLEEQVSS